VVKKTVAIHPVIDRYVRRVWALLVESGYNAKYSTAVNFILLGGILEALKDGGWSEETRKAVLSFIEDEEVLNRLNLESMVEGIVEKILPKEVREKVRRGR